jgi:hypothetical protein
MLRKSGTSGSGRGHRKRTHHGHLAGGLLHRTPGSGSGLGNGPGESRHRAPGRLHSSLEITYSRSKLRWVNATDQVAELCASPALSR